MVAKESSLCEFIIEANSTIYIFGGDPFAEERFIDWNFVASDIELIKNAKQKWIGQSFEKIKGDEKEYVTYPAFNQK